MGQLQFESIDGSYKNGDIGDVTNAMHVAHAGKMQGFKLYNHVGNFIREYALFDGKFRKVEHNGEGC